MLLGKRKKILIVDPEAVRNLALWQSACPDAEYELITAPGAEAGFKNFSEAHPDLIIIRTDIDKDHGRDLCRKVRVQEGQRHTGVIFWHRKEITSDQLVVDCLESGADDFLGPRCSIQEIQARVRSVLRLKGMTDELRSANHRLQMLSMTDELTGLANMRCFNSKFMIALKLCRAGHSGLGVIMLDLDHFKQVNDSSNHLVGSYIIGEVGRLIKNSGIFSEHDVAARYGGDEFIIFCPAQGLTDVVGKAEELRFRIFQSKFQRDGMTFQITASLGCIYVESGFAGQAEGPIKAADMMLYRSKGLGRDRVSGMVLHPDSDLKQIERFLEIHDTDRKAVIAPTAAKKAVGAG